MIVAEPWLEPGVTCAAIADAESGALVDAADYYRAVADAIEHAERYVLVLAWQLDTRVVLRRHEDEVPEEHTLRAVLARACRRAPELVVRLLPWDYSPVYVPDREWATRERLEEIAEPGRVRCVWDAHHPIGASQHEKMVLVDGHTAFVGGIDLCDDRWDDRGHLPDDPRRRNLKGVVRGPYHDVQAVVRGEAVSVLERLFEDRWLRACGELLALPPAAPPPRTPLVATLPIDVPHVAIARTRPTDPTDGRPEIREVEALHVRAIERAERFVYVETQYLTAHSLVDALCRRMASGRGPLQVAILLPRCTEGALERAAIAVPQAAALHALANAAARHGHALGTFCSCASPAECAQEELPITYVHSKLLVVDDTFLAIGTANLTNRSMGFDSELVLAWAADDDAGRASIRRLRVSLIAEHTGLPEDAATQLLRDDRTLVRDLVHLAALPEARLIGHGAPPVLGEPGPIDQLFAEIGDPAHA